MSPLLLRPPRPDDEAVIVGAHAEVRPEGHDFALFFDEEPSYAAWLARVERQTRGIVPQPHLVKSDYLLAEVDGQVVGRVSIRHVLNERLHHQVGTSATSCDPHSAGGGTRPRCFGRASPGSPGWASTRRS